MHDELGARFNESLTSALIYDYEVGGNRAAVETGAERVSESTAEDAVDAENGVSRRRAGLKPGPYFLSRRDRTL